MNLINLLINNKKLELKILIKINIYYFQKKKVLKSIQNKFDIYY
jgi:hypothetical protein